MKVVNKLRLATDGSKTMFRLKYGYRIVESKFSTPDECIYIWVEQNNTKYAREQEVVFRVVRSGYPVPDSMTYTASAVDNSAMEAYHIYEKPEAELPGIHLDYYPHSKYGSEQQRA